MSNLLRCEIRKALCNRWFFSSVVIGCALVLISAVLNIEIGLRSSILGVEHLGSTWSDLSSLSSLKYWIVVDFIQPTTILFFLLAPFLATLPYVWSYLEENKNGYVGAIVVRSSRLNYCFSKLAAVFLSGALAITIPILFNLLFCACFIPIYTPDVYAVIFFGIYEQNLWSEVFYTNPLLYIILYTLLNFIFSGLWASAVLALSRFFRRRAALLVVPYLAWWFIEFIAKSVLIGVVNTEITPFAFLRGSMFPVDGGVVAIILAVLIIISAGGLFAANRSDVL